MTKFRSEAAYLKEQVKDADVRFAQKDSEVCLHQVCLGYLQ
jgi:hypothetical protein